MHENYKEYNCESCDKSFGTKSHLKAHFKIIHENIKAYKCESCLKRFGKKSTLKHHVKTVHENCESFKCESCDKCFGEKSTLEKKDYSYMHQRLQMWPFLIKDLSQKVL